MRNFHDSVFQDAGAASGAVAQGQGSVFERIFKVLCGDSRYGAEWHKGDDGVFSVPFFKFSRQKENF